MDLLILIQPPAELRDGGQAWESRPGRGRGGAEPVDPPEGRHSWDVGLGPGFSQARRLLLGKASQGAVGVARGRSGPAEGRKADECKIADK